METSDILKRVRQIEIKTRGLSNNIFAGQYHSAFKGKGMSFSEVREYQYGDDVRDIDWNVTARYHKPYVKVFEEERELTVMLLIDVSNSLDFGTLSGEYFEGGAWKSQYTGGVSADGKMLTLKSTDENPITCVYEACTIPEDVINEATTGTRSESVIPFL